MVYQFQVKHSILVVLSFLYLLSCTSQERPKGEGGALLKQEVDIEEEPPTAEETPDSLNGWELMSPEEAMQEPEKPTFEKQEVASEIYWKPVGKGVSYTEIDAPLKCSISDSKIRIVKIDASKAKLKMISHQKYRMDAPRTAEEYAEQFKLAAVINTSMFGGEGRSVGFMKDSSYINNGRVGKDKSIIAFNPKSSEWPAFKIIDRSCDDWEVWKERYHSYIQNIRMIGCDGKVKWSKQEKYWSTACIAEDIAGNCLFIHARSPYRVHDLSAMLLQLPLGIRRCCYAEGGPESSLFVQMQDTAIRAMGSYETGFMDSDGNHEYWGLPNVLGVTAEE